MLGNGPFLRERKSDDDRICMIPYLQDFLEQ